MPDNNFRIRPAAATDLEPMVELLTELFTIESDFTPDVTGQRQGLRQLLACPQALVLVAEETGTVVGRKCRKSGSGFPFSFPLPRRERAFPSEK